MILILHTRVGQLFVNNSPIYIIIESCQEKQFFFLYQIYYITCHYITD